MNPATDKEAPLKRSGFKKSLNHAIYLLTVLTVLLLIGIIFFLSSISIWWQTDKAVDVPLEEAAALIEVEANDEGVSEDETGAVRTLTAAVVDPVAEATAETAVNEPSDSSGEAAASDLFSQESVQSPTQNQEPQFGQLIIPNIDVRQQIVPIFIKDGQWDISEIGSNVGHLESTGKFPYDNYAMTFTGHVSLPWPEISGPFTDLIFLEHGEEIIYRWNGTDYIYKVERIFRVAPTAVDMLYEQDGKKLILVTCSGWDFSDREYAERLVTRAVLVREEPSPPTRDDQYE